MKRFFAIITLGLIAITANAQKINPSEAPEGQMVFNGSYWIDGVRLNDGILKTMVGEEAFRKDYLKAKRMYRFGNSITCVGIGVIALGAGDMLLESIVNESGDVYQNIKTGLFISGTGLLITAVGLPLMVVGKKKSIEFTNRFNNGTYDAELTLGPTTQGLGIALNF